MNGLIKALRGCADTENIIDGCDIESCHYNGDVPNCIDKMMRDAADAIEKLTAERTQMKNALIERICANCDTPPETRLRVCGECPIIQPIRDIFSENL